MTLLNVSFGIYAFMPLGWLFMALIIILECLTMTRLLLPVWRNKKIYGVIVLTNVISGLFGIVISMVLNGGWYLVVWLPWVSRHEVDLTKKEELNALLIYYAAAFVLTLMIETLINVLFLRKQYPKNKIIKATIVTNIISYAIGTLALYSYSFH